MYMFLFQLRWTDKIILLRVIGPNQKPLPSFALESFRCAWQSIVSNPETQIQKTFLLLAKPAVTEINVTSSPGIIWMIVTL